LHAGSVVNESNELAIGAAPKPQRCKWHFKDAVSPGQIFKAPEVP